MKKLYITLLLVIAVFVIVGISAAASVNDFSAPLSGDQEVPPRDTPAEGHALFQIRKGGSELRFRVTVSDIENVFAAHIHCAPAGVNGPVGVTLFMGMPGSGPVSGVLAQGKITAPDPGNGCGWMTLSDVLTAMRMGNAYVNVHTNDGVDPPNTGPGDFPGGEIRGQISG
jgi:hypothetical protein